MPHLLAGKFVPHDIGTSTVEETCQVWCEKCSFKGFVRGWEANPLKTEEQFKEHLAIMNFLSQEHNEPCPPGSVERHNG